MIEIQEVGQKPETRKTENKNQSDDPEKLTTHVQETNPQKVSLLFPTNMCEEYVLIYVVEIQRKIVCRLDKVQKGLQN